TLYSRLKEAKEKSANGKWKGSNDTTPNDSYARFLDLLYSFLGGVIDSTKYEDDRRAILGTWSFSVFTLDKLIHKLSKQLLAIATDEVENKLIKLYVYEHMRKPGRFVDDLYNANARVIVNDETIYSSHVSIIMTLYNEQHIHVEPNRRRSDWSEYTRFTSSCQYVNFIIPLLMCFKPDLGQSRSGFDDTKSRAIRKKNLILGHKTQIRSGFMIRNQDCSVD
ncbi:paired amphipathic helix protein Sin3-like protein 3 isoform X1, partial [Tanacetum coccineum]